MKTKEDFERTAKAAVVILIQMNGRCLSCNSREDHLDDCELFGGYNEEDWRELAEWAKEQ